MNVPLPSMIHVVRTVYPGTKLDTKNGTHSVNTKDFHISGDTPLETWGSAFEETLRLACERVEGNTQ